MKRLAVLCFLVGCFSDEVGLHIVVHDEVGGAETVDMYIVVKDPGKPGMTPKDAPRPMTGPVFVLDSAKPPRNGTLSDGVVVFNILPEDADEKVDVVKVAFIGRDAQNNAVSFGYFTPPALEVGGSVAYRVDLTEQASSVAKPSDVNTLSGVRVYEWDGHVSSTARAKCTDVEFAEDAIDGGVIHYFFVPPDDLDCDGATECTERDELVYGVSPVDTGPPVDASLDNTECAPYGSSNGDTQCHLGYYAENACAQGGAEVCTAFTDEKFCAPLSVCEHSNCFMDPDKCFGDSSLPGSIGTYLDCKISADDVGKVCADPGASSVFVDFGVQLAMKFGFGNPTTCEGVQIWRPGHTTDVSAMDMLTSTFVQSISGQGVPFAIVPNFSPGGCEFTLAYLGGALSREFLTGGIEIKLGMNRHLVLPVRVTFTACNQSAQSKCNLIADDVDEHALGDCVF